MADRRITDLDSIGTLSTGDLFVVTDADQSGIGKSATIGILTNYVLTQVPSSARAFGGGVNEIATWAEGDNLDIIPSSKLPAAIIPDLTNYVTLDTTQVIDGVKNFLDLRVNSQEVVTLGNTQTITGTKTISAPNLTGITEVDTVRFSDGSTQDTAFAGSGGIVTKAAVDAVIGVSPTGNSGQFYNQQGNFLDPQYDTIENAPIIRNRTIENITINGTRSNVIVTVPGSNEMSTITMQNTFDSTPTQYTTVFASPNTSLVPALVLSAGSQGRQLSLTEADGTLHRFAYTTNGNYRLLDGGLTGTVRLGAQAVATTATVTAAVSVPDQTAGQTITLTGDQTGVFSVGDFISPLSNNFGAYRGIFIESVTLNGGNTDIVGTSNGAATFQTTSTLYLAGPADEVQGTVPTFSGDPDIGDVVYTSSIPATEFTIHGVNTSAHLIQVANAYAALETAITTDGIVTDNGDGTSSITIDYGTETNIDSSFTITGGLNNMESIVNTDGTGDTLSPATTITIIDPEATEITSFTASVTDANDNNVDDIGIQIANAVNANVETPINFVAIYDTLNNTVHLVADRAGNTNPWTIVFNNNGTTGANAGNLSTITVQTGEVINQTETLSVVNTLSVLGDAEIESLTAGGIRTSAITGSTTGMTGGLLINSDNRFEFQPNINDNVLLVEDNGVRVNFPAFKDVDFEIAKSTLLEYAFRYDSGTDTTTIDSDTINFVGNNITGLPTGANGLSITDTVNLNLLDGTTVLSTVVLPSAGGTTIIAGTANEIINTVSGNTNTLSLDTAITGAISDNTTAIALNTAKTGITTAQSSAIITNTAKNSYPSADSTKLATIEANADVTDTTNVVDSLIAGTNITISSTGVIAAAGVVGASLTADQTFTGVNTFNNAAGGIQVDRITGIGDTDTYLSLSTPGNSLVLSAGGQSVLNGLNVGSTTVSVLGTSANITASAGTTNSVTINNNNSDTDFIINKQTSGTALSYDSGTDTLTTEAANLVGFSEIGTWTPVFTNGGSTIALTAEYSKTGNTVNVELSGILNVGASAAYSIATSSLPFAPTSTVSLGLFTTSNGTITAVANVTSTSITFRKPDGTQLQGDELTGIGAMSITYQDNN